MDYEFLRQWLKEHRITRAQFAQDIGVSRYDVNNWLSRKPKRFPYELVVKISEKYRIPLDKLTGIRYLTPEEVEALWGEKKEDRKEDEKVMLSFFHKLNGEGRDKAIDAVELLTKIPEYLSEYDTDDWD